MVQPKDSSPTRSNPAVAVIAVTYRSDSEAVHFVRSATRCSRLAAIDVPLVIVDNSSRNSSEDLFEKLKKENGSVVGIRPEENTGYFGGARIGLDAYLRREAGYPDWLIVSNVDLEFEDSFFAVLKVRSRSERVGILAPSIMSIRYGHDWNPFMLRRPSRIRMHAYRMIYHHTFTLNLYSLMSRIKSRLHKKSSRRSNVFKTATDRAIYAPHGSCVIFSRRFFEMGGNLDYPCFLFGEETFLAESARELSLQVMYAPALKIVSTDHASTGIYRSAPMVRMHHRAAKWAATRYFA